MTLEDSLDEPRHGPIAGKIWWKKDGIGAKALCAYHGHGRANSKMASFVRRGADHRARTAPGNDHGPATQLRVIPLLHRRIEGVHVRVHDLAQSHRAKFYPCDHHKKQKRPSGRKRCAWPQKWLVGAREQRPVEIGSSVVTASLSYAPRFIRFLENQQNSCIHLSRQGTPENLGRELDLIPRDSCLIKKPHAPTHSSVNDSVLQIFFRR